MQTNHPDVCSYATRLLRSLDITKNINGDVNHPAIAWRRAGLDDVTGQADGPALVSPVALTSAADGALLALKSIAPLNSSLPENGALLLGERSQLMELTRQGDIAPGGSCYLLETANGAAALNLARKDDWTLLSAWLEVESFQTIEDVKETVRTRSVTDLIERGVEMGLALSAIEQPRPVSNWFHVVERGQKRNETPNQQPLVVDLSSLWAGPLAGNLLSMLGAEVVKVESFQRPDGSRVGDEEFFTLLNGGKASVALNFSLHNDLQRLKALLSAADIVIEGSRPRALRQLGIDAAELVHAKAGKVWVSITAYGRDKENEMRIGFGDDVAAGAGLTSLMRDAYGKLMFCGDASADPLTGIHAALSAWASWGQGESVLLDISMKSVTAHAIAFDKFALETDRTELRGRAVQWNEVAAKDNAPLYEMRSPIGPVRELGADTEAVLKKLSIC